MALLSFSAYETLAFGVVNYGGFMNKPACISCNDTGVIDTGNNELPCDQCPKGDTAKFNVAGVKGPITGAEVKRHYLNNSPEPR